jgi:hypothetical protein
MTTPLIPDFIVRMFENELRKIIGDIISYVSKEFGIDADILRKQVHRHVGIGIHVVKEDEEVVKIVKLKPRKAPDDVFRCKALIMKNGDVQQCMLQKQTKCDFCKRHRTCPSKYGVIGDPSNVPIPGENPLQKYYKIY